MVQQHSKLYDTACKTPVKNIAQFHMQTSKTSSHRPPCGEWDTSSSLYCTSSQTASRESLQPLHGYAILTRGKSQRNKIKQSQAGTVQQYH